MPPKDNEGGRIGHKREASHVFSDSGISGMSDDPSSPGNDPSSSGNNPSFPSNDPSSPGNDSSEIRPQGIDIKPLDPEKTRAGLSADTDAAAPVTAVSVAAAPSASPSISVHDASGIPHAVP